MKYSYLIIICLLIKWPKYIVDNNFELLVAHQLSNLSHICNVIIILEFEIKVLSEGNERIIHLKHHFFIIKLLIIRSFVKIKDLTNFFFFNIYNTYGLKSYLNI